MITIAGCGDAFINRMLPENRYSGWNDLANLLHSHDARFCNLETTIHDNEGYPAAYPGGGWAMARPNVLESLEAFGFNALSLANNHMLDYSHAGLEATLRHLGTRKFATAGAGMNLAQASKPSYVECQGGRVAFIAATSSFHDADAAGNQGLSIAGRPGVNPLRHKAVYQLTPDLYRSVLEIGSATGMNDTLSWSAANGYRDPEKNATLRSLSFAEGPDNRKISHPADGDMKRITNTIHDARKQAACVVVSIHSHQFKHDDETPDDFIVEFCHRCIDEGAHIVFGHGSHIVRGIEAYHGGVIFYGLGDFILQNESMEYLPADFYEKQLPDSPELWNCVGAGMDVRSAGGTRGLSTNRKAFESLLASVSFDHGAIAQATIHPIELHFSEAGLKGWPRKATARRDNALQDAVRLSKRFATQIDVRDGVGTIRLK